MLNVTENSYDTQSRLISSSQYRPDPIEVSTTRNVYGSGNLLVFTGTTTGPATDLTWHSISANYYTAENLIEHVVQLDVSDDVLDSDDLAHFNIFFDGDPISKCAVAISW